MKFIAGTWLVAYAFAWWATFWLPTRKTMFSPLAFIPTAVCAFGIPMLVSDTIRGTPHEFLIFWSVTPFVVVVTELIWKWKKNKNPNHTSQPIAGKPGSG